MPSNKCSSAGQGDYLVLLIRTIETVCYVPADDDDVDDMWEESVADISLLDDAALVASGGNYW